MKAYTYKIYRENNTNHIQIQIIDALQAFLNNITRTHKAKRAIECNIWGNNAVNFPNIGKTIICFRNVYKENNSDKK